MQLLVYFESCCPKTGLHDDEMREDEGEMRKTTDLFFLSHGPRASFQTVFSSLSNIIAGDGARKINRP